MEQVGGIVTPSKVPKTLTVWIGWVLSRGASAEIVVYVSTPSLMVQIGCLPLRYVATPTTVNPRAHHVCRRHLRCWVNKVEPLVSAAKLAARDRTLNEWFKVSSERLSQLINLLMAVHVWTEAGVGDGGHFFRLLHHLKSRQTCVQQCARSFGSQNPAACAGLALFSLISPKHQKSVAARTWPSTLSLQARMKERNPHLCPSQTALHLEEFKIQEYFRWYSVWILVIIQLFWPQINFF